MAYDSESFKEHHLTRLPLLAKLLELGWERDQIICPSYDTDDSEWRVPRTPSDATRREAGRKYQGFPVDIALFDDVGNTGEYDHLIGIIECKEPGEEAGISQLETYLGLEPHARLGIWSNGTEITRVYKLPSAGKFKIVRNSTLPKPSENTIVADNEPLTYGNLHVPSTKELKRTFKKLLDIAVSRDTRSTRREDQLNQISNIILLKLESDSQGEWDKEEPLAFQLGDNPEATASSLNRSFSDYKRKHGRFFSEGDEPDEIVLDEDTIHEMVFELQPLNLAKTAPEALSLAFQVFRNATLKLGDGQYYTPLRVIEAGVELMCITHKDFIIDPACGTGGFLSAALMKVASSGIGDDAVRKWAQEHLFGVDRDRTNIKLTQALMVGIGDGSTNAYHADSLRTSKWSRNEAGIKEALKDEKYTVVLTNPPFGKGLVISGADAKNAGLTICKHTGNGEPSTSYAPTTELGIAFVERAWRILQEGGRLGIILPETYFFSKTYRWFRQWVDSHFTLRAALNVPMEAFQGFCRAKTNFYVFEKKTTEKGTPQPPKPSWYREGEVWVSNAPTIGLNKDGLDLYTIDTQGKRTKTIDDKALRDVEALLRGEETETSGFVESQPISKSYVTIPTFSGSKAESALESKVSEQLEGFTLRSLGSLIDEGVIVVRNGHGSPSADVRSGGVPYIKVSDLRAGLINPNSTNMVSKTTAEKFWRGKNSGIKAWDIATPSRASKNIGEPCMVLPGQEQMVLTKEILLFSVSGEAPIDPFYLFWALSLTDVAAQWKRVIFMQTNREDLGNRYRLIMIPYTENVERARAVSQGYRDYFEGLAALRLQLKDRKNDL